MLIDWLGCLHAISYFKFVSNGGVDIMFNLFLSVNLNIMVKINASINQNL